MFIFVKQDGNGGRDQVVSSFYYENRIDAQEALQRFINSVNNLPNGEADIRDYKVIELLKRL